MLLAAAPAGAARWLAPGVVSGSGVDTSPPDIAMAPDGAVISVWELPGGSGVQSRIRPPGQLFGQVQTLSGAGSEPRVAVGGDGTAIAIWDAGATIDYRVRRPGAASFGGVQTIPDSSGGVPVVAMNAGGTAVMAWNQDATSVNAIVRERNGSLVTPKSYPFNGEDLDIAINQNKVIALVWRDGASVRGTIRNSVGQWQPIPNELDAAGAGDPEVSIDSTGLTTALLTSGGTIRWASRPPGGQFGGSVPLDTGITPDVASSPGGRTFAVWAKDNVIQSAFRTGDNPFSTPAPVSTSPSSDPRVAVNDRNEAFAVWVRDNVIQGATSSANGGLTGVKSISNVFEISARPVVAADGSGNAATAYHQESALDAIRVAGYDGAPPLLLGLSAPTSGVPGAVLPMSLSPFDVWSPVTTSWSFGDGQGATGNAVSHAYGAAGTFNLAVTATDAAGNAASTSRPVQIFSPPPPPPPDGDGDGFNVTLDCNDADRRIFPGAPEIAGDKIDQDCNKADAPFPLLLADVTFSFDRNTARTRFFLTQLAVKDALRGMKIVMLCSGKPKCTFKRKRAGTARRARVNILKKLSRKQRRFRLGQTLSVRMTMPGHIGKVTRIKFSKRKTRSVELCLPPGSKKPRKRCT